MPMATLKSLFHVTSLPLKLYCMKVSPASVSKLHVSHLTKQANVSRKGIQLQLPCLSGDRYMARKGNHRSKHCRGLSFQQQCHFSTSSSKMTMPDIKAVVLQAISDLHHIKSSPVPSLAIGVGSVIPFIVPPWEMMSAGFYSPSLAFAQVAYGACILSFVGGIKWGTTIPQSSSVSPSWLNLTHGFAPAIIAWIGVLFPNPLNILTVITGLGTAAYFDLLWPAYPSWFKSMRFGLTAIAIFSMFLTLIFNILLDSEEKVKKLVEDTRNMVET